MKVALGGSRHLTEEPLVRHVLRCLQTRGWEVLTGCAPGIDATVRRAAVEMGVPLTVYAVGGREGGGWEGRFGTHRELRGLECAGVSRVVWAAGGEEGTMRARLHRRTVAMVTAADWGVVMVTAPDSVGSHLALRTAREQGKHAREYWRGE